MMKATRVWAAALLVVAGTQALCEEEFAVAKLDLRGIIRGYCKEPGGAIWANHESPDGGTLAWGVSYNLMALVDLYRATGEAQYLDMLARMGETILANRNDHHGVKDELRGKVIAAWVTPGYTDGKPHAWIVHSGMVTYPLASLVRIVKETPGLQAEFGARTERMLPQLAECVRCFDEEWKAGPGEGEGSYIGVSLGGKHLPLNQQNALGRTVVELATVTGEPWYKARATQMATYLKNRLRLGDDGAYYWAYWPGPENAYGGPEDMSHGAINGDFARVCYKDGIVFGREDMLRFTRTVTERICPLDLADAGLIADTVAGTGRKGSYAAQLGRWVDFAEWDRRVYDAAYLLRLRKDVDWPVYVAKVLKWSLVWSAGE